MTPIERACVAIIEALRAQGDLCDDCGEPAYAQVEGSFVVEPIARAVLSALRDPSEEMCKAAYSLEIDFASSSGSRGRTDGLYVWQAMIDAALEEG